MKKVVNGIMSLALIALVSGGVSFATFSYLNQQADKEYQSYVGDTLSTDNGQVVHRTIGRPIGLSAYEQDFTTIAENAVHAVVHIKSTVVRQGRTYVNPFEQFFFGGRGYYQEPPQKQEGYGSGVIITEDGYIVTNNHVIDQADEIEVILNDKRSFKATLVGTDPSTDIALLKIDADDLAIIPFGNSDDLKVGEWVLAVGNPFNLTSTVTAGIVSAKARNLGTGGMSQRGGGVAIESFIQTDAAVNPGNSGGALVNTKGELVGINTAITSQTGNFAGHSFAVPTSIVSKVISDLKEFGLVQRVVLGISYMEITPQLKEEKNLTTLDGIYVSFVENRSSALDAGIEVGDVLISVNGTTTKNATEFKEQLNRFRPGDEIKMDLLRDGKKKTVSVVLRNSKGGTEIVKENDAEDENLLGASFEELSDNQKRQLGISYGVQVSKVGNGKLKDANVMKGFVILKINDKPIQSVKDISDVVVAVKQNGSNYGEQALFVVGLKPNGKAAYFAIDLSE